jgi:hypothetical protein
MVNLHIKFPVGVAMPGVVDALPKYLVVEGVVQGQREKSVEGSHHLILGSPRFDLGGRLIEHFLQVNHICFIVRLHSLQGHVVRDVYRLDSLARRQPEAEETSTEGKFLIVGQLIRQY